MNNHLRTDTHKRTKVLEDLLDKVNCLLEEPELNEVSHLKQPKLPTVFIVGNPRSGTTLLYQWLAATGLFAYPSNIMSRFTTPRILAHCSTKYSWITINTENYAVTDSLTSRPNLAKQRALTHHMNSGIFGVDSFISAKSSV